MRSTSRILFAAAVAALAFPQFAMAEDIEEQLRLMNERMSQLEDQLQATNDELEQSKETVERQQVVMEKAGLEDPNAKSGLDSFFSMIEVEGNVTVGWNFNFNQPEEQNAGANIGRNGVFYPFHPDHNSFELNQFWLAMEKPVSQESRAGFRVDMVYGKTASILGSGLSGIGRAPSAIGAGIVPPNTSDSASDFHLYQAYVQYLIPWGDITLKAGKFETIIGVEVARATENFNISRGNMYNLMQPFTHYGAMISGNIGESGFRYNLGGVNRARCCGNDPDTNDAKSLLASVGYGGETFGADVAIAWGAEQNGNSAPVDGLLDVKITWDPTDRFSAYINYDYQWIATRGLSLLSDTSDPDAWGLAVAGRYGITETLGLAIRAEFLQDSGNLFGLTGTNPGGVGFIPQDSDIWGITGTFDWTITDGLIAKAEIRYDRVNGNQGSEAQFVGSGPGGVSNGIANVFTNNDQLVGLVELTYQF